MAISQRFVLLIFLFSLLVVAVDWRVSIQETEEPEGDFVAEVTAIYR